MTPIDVTMTEEDKKVISEYIIMNETVKRLDKDKKKLTEKVKDIFDKYNITDPLDFDGNTLTVTESVRRTVQKAKKDRFVQELVNMGKGYLIIHSMDIDVDAVSTELESGSIDKDFVSQFMSITPVKTLTCK